MKSHSKFPIWSQTSIKIEHSKRYSSKPQVEPSPFPILRTNVANRNNQNFQTNTQIDSMMLLKRL